ncbi:translation initiation factor IF-2 N-terminal domain-containing protein, partial [Mycetohabitans sp. B46]|uniref:translation initiation factor IF-2 N-terminal domain-containing protein n=1 Tax=Mycetohabitans sp. B46 TaxID=2772536 RepID=UPI00307CF5DA
MASNNVAQFAAELKMPAGLLLEQLQAAGVQKANADDVLSEADKARLLDHLRKSHGSADGDKRKITLTRRQTSEIKQADATGKARTIQVEVRKKRVFVKRDEPGTEAPNGEDQDSATAELARREEQARLEAEALAQQARELQERQERLEREEAQRRAREEAAQAERRRAEEEAARRAAQVAQEQAQAQARAAAQQVAEQQRNHAEQQRNHDAPQPADQSAAADARAAAERAAEREAAKKAADDARAAADKARLEQEAIRKRREAAEAEARAIREMMATPRKAMVKVPEPPKPVEPAKTAEAKGTLHKPARPAGAAAPARPAAGAKKPVSAPTAAPSGDKKKVPGKSGWQDDAAKRRGIKTRGDSSGGVDRGWRGGPRGRGKHQDAQTNFQVPTEPIVREVHVPETITVADLAHKMAVKASEVIKVMMKLGQMVTINQV